MEQPSTSCLDGNANELKSTDDEFASKQQQKLLSIFPEEMWINILERIKCANDLENLSNASLLFRRLLSSQTTVFLFPKVCKILISENFTNNYSDLLTLTKNCRLICSFWNQSVQQLFIQSQSVAPLGFSNESVDIIKTVGATTFPKRWSSGIEEFVRDFERTHYLCLPFGKNPFLGRSVVFDDTCFQTGLNVNCINYLKHFWNDISTLVTKYGSHIWYCTFHLEDKFSCRQEYYFMLSGWLELMPNLKGLVVTYYCKPEYKRYSTVRLERGILENPLPKLKHLEWLVLNGLPDPISNEFVQRNKNVDRMFVGGN